MDPRRGGPGRRRLKAREEDALEGCVVGLADGHQGCLQFPTLVHSAASHPRCPEGGRGGVTSGAVRSLFNRVLLARIIGLFLPPKQETEGGR